MQAQLPPARDAVSACDGGSVGLHASSSQPDFGCSNDSTLVEPTAAGKRFDALISIERAISVHGNSGRD
jgi:hypothetical protein